MNTNQVLSTTNPEYQQLETLLKQGNWKEADYETARLILKIANREKEGV